jgi:hypothetical protein
MNIRPLTIKAGATMRIDPSTTFTPAAANTSGTVAQPGVAKSSSRDGEASAVGGVSGFTPTADLARLLSAAKELPDVRADVVQEVSGRVASGELFTPAAASDTAAAMIESKDVCCGG